MGDIFFGGARGGGKTDALCGDWTAHANKHGANARGILFRRSMPELEDVKARMMQIFPKLGATWRAAERKWVFPNKATLQLRFLDLDDDAAKYQGASYTWMAFDEAGAWPSPKPIDMLRATLRSAAGVPTRFLLTGNPGGKGHEWLRARYIDPARPGTVFQGEDGQMRVFIPSRLADNQELMKNDPTYEDRLRASGPAWLVKAWLEGDWSASEEGNIFKRDYWRFFDERPEMEFTIQSLDSAFKTGAENDYSVLTTWGRRPEGYYLLHVWRAKVEFPELKRHVVAMYEAWKPKVVLVEDKASGQSLIQELRRDTVLPINAVQVTADKLARAYAITATVEAGKVFLPRSAPWLSDFMEELAVFNKGAHDDQVDSFTQALRYLIGGCDTGLIDYYREMAREMGLA
ncbi:MAG TPA: phage terminase large subunit [Holophagaceae bacterium]|nr:phage terminase large subunit [Holophagaceae bacterium]